MDNSWMWLTLSVLTLLIYLLYLLKLNFSLNTKFSLIQSEKGRLFALITYRWETLKDVCEELSNQYQELQPTFTEIGASPKVSYFESTSVTIQEEEKTFQKQMDALLQLKENHLEINQNLEFLKGLHTLNSQTDKIHSNIQLTNDYISNYNQFFLKPNVKLVAKITKKQREPYIILEKIPSIQKL